MCLLPYQNIERPDNTGDCDYVKGNGAAKLPPLQRSHVELFPLRQRLHLQTKLFICVHNSNDQNFILENEFGQVCLDGRNKKKWQVKQTPAIRTTCPAPQQIEYSIHQLGNYWQNETVTMTPHQYLSYFVSWYALLPNHSPTHRSRPRPRKTIISIPLLNISLPYLRLHDEAELAELAPLDVAWFDPAVETVLVDKLEAARTETGSDQL